ncbi:MAG: two-component regulator propeller domain-containing protein, partial [Bacteroidales bacterium]|nr:two-component regulator propeller domain-containing protein [Bacteroidales bacterium]
KGLSIYDKKSNSFNSVYSSDNPQSLSDNFVLQIINDKKGDIWIGTANGLNKLIGQEKGHLKFKRYGIEPNNGPFLIQDLLADSNNNIWIACKKNGLYKLDAESNRLLHISDLPNFKTVSKDIRALCFDQEENLWIGTYSGVCILKKNGSVDILEENNAEHSYLKKIKSIFCDKKGSIWIGAYYGGVSVWDPSFKNFTNLDQTTLKCSLSYHVVGSIVSDQKSKVYFGTEGGGVTILNLETGKTEFLNKKNTKGLSSDNVKSLYLSDKNELWIGTFTEGIFIVDPTKKRILKNKLSKELQETLSQTGVYSIKQENSNIIWIGTFGKGLIRYNLHSKKIKVFENKANDSNMLSNNRVRSIFIDSSKRMWVATQSGLNCSNLAETESEKIAIKHYFYDRHLNSGTDILCIFEDSYNKIWVGTKGNGFYLFDDGDFKKVEIKNSNSEISSIHAIAEDNGHFLWLSSNHGIVKYNPQNNSFTLYDQTDGIVSNEFNDNSVHNFKNQKIFFGGPAGITFFDPLNIMLNSYAPQVIITDLMIKNEPINPDGADSILDKSITYTNKIILSYDKANFSIRFAIPNFINSTNNQYAYRLKGLENEFTISNKNEVNYTIQNPGTYVFEVKGANNNAIWNNKITSLEIVVKPAPWRSPLAFALYALLIGLALFSLIRFLKSKAKLKHKFELEHREKERNEEINKSKLQFFTNISHEFRTPLTLILGPLEQILLDYKGSNKMHKRLLVIENSAKHLLHLINRLMDFRKLENNQFKLQSAEGNIVKFLKEIFFSFSEYAKDGNYEYTFDSSEDPILVYFDRNKLERVFYNIISNAFRYTPKCGRITIKIEKEKETVRISIKDNGVGIAEKYIDKIFDRFFEIPSHNHSNEAYNKGTGIGLSIAKNIVSLHSGNIAVKNNQETGAIFEVILPLGRAHLQDDEILKDFRPSDDLTQYVAQLERNTININDDVEDLVLDEDKHSILIVEDNKPLRSFIKNLLKTEYSIIEAENGKIGMQKALQHIPDLIISDVIMPEMVGTELCANIKANIKTSHIPVILLTARTSLIYKFEGLESGADEYISKPFNIKEFKLKIKNLLDSVQRLKEKFSAQDTFEPNEITVSSLDEQLLKKAFKIVEKHIENELFDIPLFCTELGVSRTMLFSKIKAWTNFTPNDFIQEIRMKRAAQLLEQNKINISQVCFKVGFRNPKYFSKCFQKKYGNTPTEYQNKFSDCFTT